MRGPRASSADPKTKDDNRRLWEAILIRAALDLRPPPAYTVENMYNVARLEKARREAVEWFSGKDESAGRDMVEVCEAAGVDPVVVGRAYRSGRVLEAVCSGLY